MKIQAQGLIICLWLEFVTLLVTEVMLVRVVAPWCINQRSDTLMVLAGVCYVLAPIIFLLITSRMVAQLRHYLAEHNKEKDS